MNRRFSCIIVFFFGALVLCGQAVAGAHEDYLRGVSSFKSLLAAEERAQYRSEWLTVLTFFEKSLAVSPKGSDAPKCMYFIGRVHEELGRRSFLDSDRKNALDAFDRMILQYPRHGWTDDSVYRKGLIWLEQKKDSPRALAIFEQVVRDYPQGDMAVDARGHIAALKTKSPAVASVKPPREAPAQPSTSSGSLQKTTLLGIRHWSSSEYTRVVLDLDRDAQYERKLLELENGAGRQLRIDLRATGVAADVMRSRTIGDGILSHVLVHDSGAQGTQVTLDLQEMDHYRVFTLPEPYRVVIDVYGPPEGKRAAPRRHQSDQVVAALEELRKTSQPPTSKKDGAAAPAKPATTVPTTAKKPADTRKTPEIAVTPKQKKYAGNLVEQLGLTVRTIMIDPGHGGKDPGAVANGVREKDVNLRMAKIMGRLLRQQGFEVHYTRTTDKFIPLEERTALANAKNADLFISVHCNAYKDGSARGLEIYYLNLATDAQAVRVAARENGVSAKKISDMQFILSDLMLNSKINESRQMAGLLQQQTIRGMRAKYGLKDHGVKGAFFYVLTGARMPSVLLELGYLTNAKEAAKLNTDAYLQAMAKGMVGGVVAYKKKLERYAASGAGAS